MAHPSPYKLSRFISPLRARQLHRALKNLKLSIICGLLTILVLRGALGAGEFGTPAKDFEEIRYQFARVHSFQMPKHVSRVLAEVVEERHRPLEAIETQVYSTSDDDVLEGAKVQINGDLQGNYASIDGNLDVKSTFDLTKPCALSPKFSDWDAQRRAWLPTINPNSGQRKPKMMLVTGYHPSACENPTGNHYFLKFIKNKVDYCKLHGIEILYNSAVLEAEMAGVSTKRHLLRRLMLAHPEVEWFWWMDSDAMFADMAFELPMEKFENYNLVMHEWNDMVYELRSWAALTSGSFLFRNCQWSLNMLDTWLPIEPEGQVPEEAGKLLARQSSSDDQPMFAHLIMNEKKNLGKKVPLQKSIYLHGHWKVLVHQSEEEVKKNHIDVGGESRPFVMQFVRDKTCQKGVNPGDYNADPYFKYMERAFDLADSQILQLSSFEHKSSTSSVLRRLRGGYNGNTGLHSDVLLSSTE